MAAPVFLQASQAQWTGAFPFSFNMNADLTGANCALIFLVTTGSQYGFTPTFTVGGFPASHIDTISGANSGSIYAYKIEVTAPGSSVAVVGSTTNYVDNGQCCVLAFSGVETPTLTGDTDKLNAQGTPSNLSLSITLSGNDSLVVTHANAYFTGGSLTNTAANPTATVISTNTTNPNLPSSSISQTGGTSGSLVTNSWQAPFNAANAISIELLGLSSGGGSSSSLLHFGIGA